MRDSKRFLILVLTGLAVIAFGAAVATAECTITGNITAEENVNGPDLGAWCYTLELVWDTGSQHALSHFNLLIDTAAGDCECEEIADALAWEDPAGSSDGHPDGCTVFYEAMLECDGDPSIPGVDGILLKFEPYEGEGCEPGTTGTGIFVFYSDFEPAPIDENNLYLVDKFAGDYCSGMLTGVFPAILCDPVSNETSTWSRVKATYE